MLGEGMSCTPAEELAARKTKGQEANDSSLLHQLDLALRHMTGDRMRTAVDDPDRRALAQRCSEARRAAMAACRHACAAGQTRDGGAVSIDRFIAVFEQQLETYCEPT
jgi:hypothetical protein